MKHNQWYHSRYITIHSRVNGNETININMKMGNMEKKLQVVNDT